ncbi:MAG: hypothetical protein ACI9WS_001380 [Paraglaciecola psychrophila]
MFCKLAAIGEVLLGLPANNLIGSTLDDPWMQKFYLLLLLTFIVGYIGQFFWLKKRALNTVAASTKIGTSESNRLFSRQNSIVFKVLTSTY